MAESLLQSRGEERFRAYSAGLAPVSVHPVTRAVLADMHLPTQRLRSKGLHEFAGWGFDWVVVLDEHLQQAVAKCVAWRTLLVCDIGNPLVALQDPASQYRSLRAAVTPIQRVLAPLLDLVQQPNW